MTEPRTDPFAPSDAPDPEILVGCAAEWREREQALARHGPPELAAWLEPGEVATLPAGLHGRLEAWLPMRPLRRAIHGVLRGYFAQLLDTLDADLEQAELARARSWVDARRRLHTAAATPRPSALFEALTDPPRARALLTELFAPPGYGAGLGRHPQRLARLGGLLAGRERLAIWDVGTATGEGLYELSRVGLRAGARVEALGTDRCGVQLRMARHRVLPHAPAREAALHGLVAETPELLQPGRCALRFERHDATAAPPVGPWDLITCHGLLGEGLRGRDVVVGVARRLAAALAPGGLLSVADTFRDDRRRDARAWILAADLPGRGLSELEPGLFLRG